MSQSGRKAAKAVARLIRNSEQVGSVSDLQQPKQSNFVARTTRVYCGRDREVFVRDSEGARPLRPPAESSTDAQNHFSWGVDDQAGKRLAAALLADALDDDKRTAELTDIFNARVISILPQRWSMTRERIFVLCGTHAAGREPVDV